MGDFNDLLNISDKRGAHDHPNWLFSGFRSAVMDSGLQDLPLQGYPFTWSRSRGKPTGVEERLDRCLVNTSWLGLFPNAMLKNITTPISDHTAILLHTSLPGVMASKKRFRFENKWLSEAELPDLIQNYWTNRQGMSIIDHLSSTAEALSSWSKSLNETMRRDKKDCEAEIERYEYSTDAMGIERLLEAKKKLGNILLKEEIYWKQRAK